MDYFRRRAEQERVAAQHATDERAALTHRELAGRYDDLASGGVLPVPTEPKATTGTLPRDLQIFS